MHRVCNHPVPKPRGSPAVRGFDFIVSFHSRAEKNPTQIAVTCGVGAARNKQGSRKGIPREPNHLQCKAQSCDFGVRTFGEELTML